MAPVAFDAPPRFSAKPRPLPNFLNTNYDDIYAPRTPSGPKISALREAINSLDAQMARLMTQRQALKSQLEQEVRLQSPVIRLPSELLSSIFVIGVLGMGDEDPIMVPTLMLVWFVNSLSSVPLLVFILP